MYKNNLIFTIDKRRVPLRVKSARLRAIKYSLLTATVCVFFLNVVYLILGGV